MGQVSSVEAGIAGAWNCVHQLSQEDLLNCVDLAGQAIRKYELMIDKEMMIYDVIWRFSYISSSSALLREYQATLFISKHFEKTSSLARWVVPTIVQFCFVCEILRRRMWSSQGAERAEVSIPRQSRGLYLSEPLKAALRGR